MLRSAADIWLVASNPSVTCIYIWDVSCFGKRLRIEHLISGEYLLGHVYWV